MSASQSFWSSPEKHVASAPASPSILDSGFVRALFVALALVVFLGGASAVVSFTVRLAFGPGRADDASEPATAAPAKGKNGDANDPGSKDPSASPKLPGAPSRAAI